MIFPPINLWPIIILILLFFLPCDVAGVQILSKSKLDKCEKTSNSGDLNCTKKIVLNMAVPSGASGGEDSIVAETVEVEENSSKKMQTIRIPPVLTVNKSAAYALYELTYIQDVAYKPEEYYVKTRKCEPDADAKVVQICMLRDENGTVIQHTEIPGHCSSEVYSRPMSYLALDICNFMNIKS